MLKSINGFEKSPEIYVDGNAVELRTSAEARCRLRSAAEVIGPSGGVFVPSVGERVVDSVSRVSLVYFGVDGLDSEVV